MNSCLQLIAAVALAVVAAPALAALNVFRQRCPNGARSPTELGGDKVDVYTATNALQDPHHVEAKPSLIARARSADLVVATGAELEIGWLPLVTQQAGNPKIQPGKPGLLRGGRLRARCSKSRRASTAPTATSIRAAIRTSRPIRATSRAWPAPLAARLAELDPANAAYYQARYKAFADALERGDRELGEAGGAAQGRADRRPAQGLHLSRGLARARTRSPRSSPSPASSRRPRISPTSSRRCSGSR